jgi:hypothetical protein
MQSGGLLPAVRSAVALEVRAQGRAAVRGVVIGAPGGARSEPFRAPRYYDDPLAAYLVDGRPPRVPFLDVLG